MANIGATTAFYKVETSLTRANSEVSKSMERLATGKQNANAGDRSSYVAMADTFRLDYVGTKAGIKGASVVMGYLETGMRTLDAASGLLSRLQELAVLGSNNTNTDQDHEAINLEAEAIADEFNRLMTTSTYKGKDIFTNVAASERVALGGRAAEMSFGIGKVTYTELYGSAGRTIATGPNASAVFNLKYLPSDSVRPKAYGAAVTTLQSNSGAANLLANKSYIITSIDADGGADIAVATNPSAARNIAAGAKYVNVNDDTVAITGNLTANKVIKVGGSNVDINAAGNHFFREVRADDDAFVAGETYVVYSLGQSNGNIGSGDAQDIANATSVSANITVGTEFTVNSNATKEQMAQLNALTQGMTFTRKSSVLTKPIEDIQAKINTARVQAGSQYAAIESSIAYTTDLTAQYELGYNTVSDVNFSMETAHLAKNQILQQAATAMLAQANQGQQSLLQLIQG